GDGGATWTVEENQVGKTLHSLSIVGAENVWAVGDNRTIVYRDNTSTPISWVDKSLPGTDQFKHIFMNDANHGWIISNDISVSPTVPTLLWTSDSWQTVQAVSLPPGVGALSSIFFLPVTAPVSSIDGWAVGDVDTGTGEGTILYIHSDDLLSPGTVTKQTSGVLTDLSDIYFSDLNSGWAVGKNGTILFTSNGGTTWTPTTYSLPPLQRLEALAFNNGVGVTVGQGGVVVAKGGGVAPWVTISGAPRDNLNAIAFAPDGLNGWAVGEANTILNTSNGGISWGPAPGTYAGIFNGVSAITASDVWAVTSGKQIYHYNGSVWSLNTTLSGSGILKGVYFPNATYGWAVGKIGTNEVFYYNGSSWTSQGFCSTTTTMNSVYFIDGATPPTDSMGWAVGTGGTIGRTTNGGAPWTCQAVGGNPAVTWNSVYFVDASNGWVVGNSGKIYHTSNGGVNWSSQTSHTTATLYNVRFSDTNTGWAVGSGGVVVFTTDGGSTWTSQMSGTSQDLKGIAFFKDINNIVKDVWTVGSKLVPSGDPPLGGAILHTTTGGN
ncbi:MAG: hypothetical protein EPO39_18285, partial [Candidatus Manganitrophaceae bacterium]